ncbi:hypothetical protein BDV25DRAFT_144822 [Aspergillus avenaceus]|uniref:Uncharacterized protein n=1 Tax=Aspergillus avenaceus TaxID=36643 RepID=A0A5N6TFW4_ASPAV|nr:hypothetical protein BDV25DRAFT_144822 [Aspergillus avenaceus]
MEASTAEGNKDVSFSGDFDPIFSFDSLSNDCGGQSPTISTSKQPHQSPQPWPKDFWSLSQDPVGHGALAFQDTTTIHPSAVSDLSVNLEAPSTTRPAETRTSPTTPPETPSRKSNKSALVTSKPISRHREPNGRRGAIRKHSYSPSLTRPSQSHKGKMAYPEAWAPHRIQNYSFLRSSDERFPLSPPPSDILVQHENMCADSGAVHLHQPRDTTDLSQQFDAGFFNQSPAMSMPSPSAGVIARQPTQYLSHSHNSTLSTSSPPSTDEIFPSPHSSDPQSISSWNSDTLGTPALPFTPDLQTHDSQAWWSSLNPRVAQRQPSYQQIASSPSPPHPIPNTIQNTNSHHDMLQGGLMIQLDPSSFDMSATGSPSYPSSTIPAASTQENHTYNHVPVPQQTYVESPTFTTLNPQKASRSPSLSPRTGGTPNGLSTFRHGLSMKTQCHKHGRKLSSTPMNTPKPVKPISGPRSPRGGSRSVAVSFVNFTQDDGQRILTGVAPSGSSKTKARREQEAREKRRKVSEAALNAVRRAGGDVEALEAVLG